MQRIRSSWWAPLSLTLAAGLAACGSDSRGTTTGPNPKSVAGIWSYSATASAGDTASCTVTGAALSLRQTDTSVAGTYTGSLTCVINGQSTPAQVSGLVSGSQSGLAVTLKLDTVVTNIGTLDTAFTSMSGTLVAKLFGDSLTGTWTATKNTGG
jgi:hypothetical protein